MITRKHRLALGTTWLILYVALNLNFGDGTAVSLVVGLIVPTILVGVLEKCGLLALSATFFFIHITGFYPVTTDLTAWYATSYLMQLALLVALSLFAFRTSLAGRKLLSGQWLEP
jgi:hypothetical protein